MPLPCDFTALAAPGVRGLTPYQPGKPESELKREYGLDSVVKLASNENPLGPSPKALEAVYACLPELARYPDGNGFELKQALSARLAVDAARITLGNGSNDVLELLARAFLTPAHNAVMSAHAFAVYPLATLAVGAKLKTAPALAADSAMPYGHDLAAMRALVDDDTRLVFIANPNNPTGTWLAPAELEAFIASLPAQVLCVLDEAYGEYMSPGQLPDSVGWLERYPNLVITRTFSKAYGLAGLRVGYALAHAQVTDLLNRVRQPFNVNLPALTAAAAALGDTAYLAEAVALNRSGLQQWQDGLTALGLGWLPSAGNFLCVDLKGRSGRELFQRLLPKGVILRPVDNYGLPGHIRVTLGTERENAIALAALGEVLAAG